jgi:hypothetical protein
MAQRLQKVKHLPGSRIFVGLKDFKNQRELVSRMRIEKSTPPNFLKGSAYT